MRNKKSKLIQFQTFYIFIRFHTDTAINSIDLKEKLRKTQPSIQGGKKQLEKNQKHCTESIYSLLHPNLYESCMSKYRQKFVIYINPHVCIFCQNTNKCTSLMKYVYYGSVDGVTIKKSNNNNNNNIINEQMAKQSNNSHIE